MRAVKGAEIVLPFRSSIAPLTSKIPKLRRPSYLVNPSTHIPNRFSETEHCVRVLTSSDSAVKQILLTMNERDNFIVEDLDDFHIIIKADEEYRVRKQLEVEVRHYSKPRLLQDGAHLSLSWRRTRTAWSDISVHKQYDKRCAYDATNPGSFSRPRIPATSSLSSEGT